MVARYTFFLLIMVLLGGITLPNRLTAHPLPTNKSTPIPQSLIQMGHGQVAPLKLWPQREAKYLSWLYQTSSVPLASFFSPPALSPEPLLIILVSFQNRTLNTTESDWAEMAFGSEDSLATFYTASSHSQFTFTPANETFGTVNNGVVEVSVALDHPNTINAFTKVQTAIYQSIVAASDFVDFQSFDTNVDFVITPNELHVLLVFAGFEEAAGVSISQSLWAHRYGLNPGPTVDGVIVSDLADDGGYVAMGELLSSTTMSVVGIMAHELGHDLGLPDLYDPDNQSSGLDDWCLMAGGAWSSLPGQLNGTSPVDFSAWCKVYLGWISPHEVTQSLIGEPIYSANSPLENIFEINHFSNSTYQILIQRREKIGIDQALIEPGIFTWLINKDKVAPAIVEANDTNAGKIEHGVKIIEAGPGQSRIGTSRGASEAEDVMPTGGTRLGIFPQSKPILVADSDSFPVDISLTGSPDLDTTLDIHVPEDDSDLFPVSIYGPIIADPLLDMVYSLGVFNFSTLPSLESDVSLFASTDFTFDSGDILVGSASLSAIPAMTIGTAQATISAGTIDSSDAVYLIAKVDHTESIAEISETNNIYPTETTTTWQAVTFVPGSASPQAKLHDDFVLGSSILNWITHEQPIMALEVTGGSLDQTINKLSFQLTQLGSKVRVKEFKVYLVNSLSGWQGEPSIGVMSDSSLIAGNIYPFSLSTNTLRQNTGSDSQALVITASLDIQAMNALLTTEESTLSLWWIAGLVLLLGAFIAISTISSQLVKQKRFVAGFLLVVLIQGGCFTQLPTLPEINLKDYGLQVVVPTLGIETEDIASHEFQVPSTQPLTGPHFTVIDPD